MKVYFAALLALPAVLAVPTASAKGDFPTTFPFQAQACHCDDGKGHITEASCLYFGSVEQPGQWCYPFASYSPRMETVFTDAYCAEATGGNLSKAVCKSITLCKNTLVPDNPDIGTFYVLC